MRKQMMYFARQPGARMDFVVVYPAGDRHEVEVASVPAAIVLK